MLDVETMSRKLLERHPNWSSEVDGLVATYGVGVETVLTVAQLTPLVRRVALACARVADEEARDNEEARNRASYTGRPEVASHRQSDVQTSRRIAQAIRAAVRRGRKGK